jgi:hypothetical protein
LAVFKRVSWRDEAVFYYLLKAEGMPDYPFLGVKKLVITNS